MDTCHVSGRSVSPDGHPLEDAFLKFEMTTWDNDGEIMVMPQPVLAYAAPDGSFEVTLWPNERGYAGTRYKVSLHAKERGLVKRLAEFLATVPDKPSASLADIMDLVPPPVISDGERNVILARLAADDAREARKATITAAGQVEDDTKTVVAALVGLEEIGGQIADAREYIRQAVVHINEVGGQVAGDREHVRQAVVHIDEVGGQIADDRIAVERAKGVTVEASEVSGRNLTKTGEDATQTGKDREATARDVRTTAESARAAGVSETNSAENFKGTTEDKRQTGLLKSAAETSAGTSQKWAEGNEPGGPSTKSAKEHAQAAAVSAALAAAATNVDFGVSIFKADGIEAGGYYAERNVTKRCKMTSLFAEIINGNVGSEATVTLLINGAPYGVYVVKQGTRLSVSGLDAQIQAASVVSFAVVSTPGTVREIVTQTYGAAI